MFVANNVASMTEDIAALAEMAPTGQAGTGPGFAKCEVLADFVVICKLLRELQLFVYS